MKTILLLLGVAFLFLTSAIAAEKKSDANISQSSIQQDRDDVSHDDFTGLALPKCPGGCIARIYLPMTFDRQQLAHFPVLDRQRNVVDARPYFESCGMTFPKGGYAWLFKSQKMLVIATTPRNLDLLEAMGPIE
jgi:hypothetical protein